MTSDERIIEVLQAARALIAQGWCQFIARSIEPNGNKSYCTVGALVEVRTDQTYFYATDAIARAIDPVLWHERGLILRWNDHPDRTQEDVLAAFDRAIGMVALRSKEWPSEL